MKYLNGKITSSGAGSQAYQDNFPNIFGPKKPPEPECVAQQGICGSCMTEGPLFFADDKAIARCRACLEAGK